MLVMPDSTILLGCQSASNVNYPFIYKGFVLCRLSKTGHVLDSFVIENNMLINGYRYVMPFQTGENLSADANGVRDLKLLPDGKVMLVGSVATGQGNYVQTTFRLKYPKLSLDSAYGINGMGQLWQGSYTQVASASAVLPDGSTIVVGNGYDNNSFTTAYAYLIKRKPNGMLDSSWQTNGALRFARATGSGINDIKVAANGNIYTCGYYRDSGTIFHAFIMKMNAAGVVDMSYGVNGMATGSYIGWSMLLNTDGSTYMNDQQFADNSYVWKFKANGKVDSTFGVNGKSVVPSRPPGTNTAYSATAMLQQPDGKLVMTGNGAVVYDSSWFVAWRVKTNGKIDSTFGTNGIVNLYLAPDVIPPGFPSPVNRSAACSALQPDGKLLIGGTYIMGNASYNEMVVVRLKNTITTLPPSGINTVQEADPIALQVYPVPASGIINISYQLAATNDHLQLSLTDITGRTVFNKNIGLRVKGSHEESISLPPLTTGSYWLQLAGSTGRKAMPVAIK